MSRFEIVRTDAGWLSRFVASNGREVWRTSETYTTRRRCRDALRILVRPLDAIETAVGVRTVADKVPPVEVRYVDERATP